MSNSFHVPSRHSPYWFFRKIRHIINNARVRRAYMLLSHLEAWPHPEEFGDCPYRPHLPNRFMYL